MTTKKLGRQTVALANPPTLAGHANVVGKKEGEGPLASSFDLIGSDDTFGEATWEKSESAMQKQALALALDKAGQAASAMDWLFAGDLLNQCIGSSFAARGQDIPFFGLYGACSTMGEGLALASMTLDGGFGEWAAVVVSSHFCTAERQYRTPLEYGGQRTPTAQWTVTGAGAAILAREGPGPYVTHCTLGKIADKGITDTNNMGAAMAPAAYATLTFRGKDLCTAEVTLGELERNDQTVDQTATLTLDFGHLWSDWTVTKEPTCTEPGEQTRTCSRCGEVETEAIAAYPCPSEAFSDLNTDQWYHEYTDYVIRHGLMDGMGDGKFAPDGKLTRGMLVTTLYRLAGEPEVTEPTTFQDVSEGRYFSDAIAWAEDVGIAKGITEKLFAPDHAITREQAVTFLYRYVTEYLKQAPAGDGDLTGFTDAASISLYAREAMSWATATGLLEGYGDGAIGPKNPVTRAQMAKFLAILDTKF